MTKFSIHIATRNRLNDLKLTLENIKELLSDAVECVVTDDGSTDGTFNYVKEHFPQVILLRNLKPKGYMFSRNRMLNNTNAEYVISLDDDAQFLSQNPLAAVEKHFFENPACALQAFRLYWGKSAPENISSAEKPERVRSFVGCGHAWKVAAWRNIPDYPEWFNFYGEENYAALHLFKKNLEVHYVPEILVHHRVDMEARRAVTSESNARFRNALKADWYLYFLFYPMPVVARKMAYSLKMQFRTKILRKHPQLIFPLMGAMCNVVYNIPNICRNRNLFSPEEYRSFMKLKETKIFWKP